MNHPAAPFLRVQGLLKTFDGHPAVDRVDLDIAKGEIFALLGPSGCGKSTLLRMLAGFEIPTAGRIVLGGQDLADLPPYRRPMNMMFQSYALFPHLNVWDNIAFGLKRDGMARAPLADRVEAMLKLVHLQSYAQRKPHQLSGGQQQRVALARCLARQPQLLLLDEPLGALDKQLRGEMQMEIKRVHRERRMSVLYVTHDQEEALTMADRLVVMNEGQVRQVGSQRDLYERPADRFVAGFVGRSSFISGHMRGDRLVTAGALEIRCAQTLVGDAVIAVRPERVSLTAGPVAADNCFAGEVEFVSYMGGLIDIHVKLSPADRVVAQIANLEGGVLPAIGQRVHVGWSANTPIFPP